jgi:hypothetical protein
LIDQSIDPPKHHNKQTKRNEQEDAAAVRAVNRAHEQGLQPSAAMRMVMGAVVGPGVWEVKTEKEGQQQKNKKEQRGGTVKGVTCTCM